MEGRICLGLEIVPAYCDVIVHRWQDFTGSKADLDGSDMSFAEVAGHRGVTAEGDTDAKA